MKRLISADFCSSGFTLIHQSSTVVPAFVNPLRLIFNKNLAWGFHEIGQRSSPFITKQLG